MEILIAILVSNERALTDLVETAIGIIGMLLIPLVFLTWIVFRKPQ